MIYKFLDIFFLSFHSLLIIFNLFGWLWKPTRKANLITLLLTGASWFILGIFYGIGYCPLTDWHWEILGKLGVTHMPQSYIQYLFIRIFNIEFNAHLVETGTAVGYFAALIGSLVVNFKKQLRKIFQLLFFAIILSHF